MRRWIVGLALAVLPHAVAHDSHPELMEAVRGLYDHVVMLDEYIRTVDGNVAILDENIRMLSDYSSEGLTGNVKLFADLLSELGELHSDHVYLTRVLFEFLVAFYHEVYPDGTPELDSEFAKLAGDLLSEDRQETFRRLLNVRPADEKPTD